MMMIIKIIKIMIIIITMIIINEFLTLLKPQASQVHCVSLRVCMEMKQTNLAARKK